MLSQGVVILSSFITSAVEGIKLVPSVCLVFRHSKFGVLVDLDILNEFEGQGPISLEFQMGWPA